MQTKKKPSSPLKFNSLNKLEEKKIQTSSGHNLKTSDEKLGEIAVYLGLNILAILESQDSVSG